MIESVIYIASCIGLLILGFVIGRESNEPSLSEMEDINDLKLYNIALIRKNQRLSRSNDQTGNFSGDRKHEI